MMDSAFLDAFASNVLKTLWNPVFKVIGDELYKIKDMDVALRKLEMSREEALNLLYKVKPSSRREADKLLSYLCEAEDLIEVIEYEIQKLKPPTYTSVSGRCILGSLKNLTKPHQIDELQKKMAKIIDDLKEQVDLSQHIQPLIKTSPPNKQLNLIGRDADVQIILEELTCSEKYGSNGVSIIGMRGVGKSALADHILNHQKVQAKFPLIVQASMFGTRFSMKDLFSKLQVVYSEGRLNGNGQGHLLDCDKWLLMLDDLDEVSSNTWCNFQTEFLTAGKKILITSLSPRVGKMAQTTLLYLKPMLEEHCRDLIRHEIDLVQRCPPPQPSISIDLAKKSCGLPLVATFLARSLLGTEEEDQWFIHDDLWKWPEIEKEILPILKSSSMSLELKLKRCFVYFSLFPHDYIFCREDLIHLWIGERLVEPHASGFVLNGQNFFNELLERSIVQPQPVDSYGLTRYEIHKFTHDFAQMPACSKAFVQSGDECMSSSYEWDKYTRHFSLSSNKQIQPSLWDKIRKHLQGLRTLLLLYNRQQIGRIGEIPSNFFDKLSGLKVLALNNTDISDLPNSVKKLKHLRYLDISNTNVKKLPEKLANLTALQILKIRTDPEIPQLPVDFNKLTNLAFIDWQESHILRMASKLSKIGNLVNLRTLPLFIVDNKEGHRITELKDMNHIQGSIKITNLHKITDEAEAKEAMLSCKSSLQKLVLIWKDNVSVAEEVLRGLKPHDQLKELRIVDYSGATFPQWLSHDVTKLQKLELVRCQSCCNLPKIGQLPDLKLLHLKKMSNIRSLDQNFCGVPSSCTTTGCFHSLESLVLHDMTELQEWNGLEANIMPSLRELKIVNCPKLKSLPSFLYQFTSLVDLQIEECISLSLIPKLPSSLESLTIGNCNMLINKCQDGGEHWSNIKHIPDVFVDGIKMPTTPAEHISSRNSENHNSSLQGIQYVIQGVVSAFGWLKH